VSVATSPRAVRTPETRSPVRVISVTGARVTKVAPPPGVADGMRAAFDAAVA